jgi:hypothetical protein
MNDFMNLSEPCSVAFLVSACMSRRRNVMLDIPPPVIHRTTHGLDNFSSDDDSDIDREDPSYQPILWGPED